MTPAICAATCESQQDRRADAVGEFEWPEACIRRTPEKGYAKAFACPRMLIQQDENAATGFECSNELNAGAPTHSDLLNRIALFREHRSRPGTYTQNRTLKRRLSRAAIDRRHRNSELGQLRGSQFPVPEMRPNHECAHSPGLGLSAFEMLETFDFDSIEHEGSVATRQQDQL
jgi:hypothetical protein